MTLINGGRRIAGELPANCITPMNKHIKQCGISFGFMMLVSSLALSQSVSPARPTTTGTAPVVKQETTPSGLIQQGKLLYRSVRLKEALEKFEAVLKLEPSNDEALGLAAVTAFRLDNQRASRDYFQRRSELTDQKDSVRAFCDYRIALTYWREVHDIVARHGQVENGVVVYRIQAPELTQIDELVSNGLGYVDRTLRIIENFAEAYNIRNLLHAEAALAAGDGDGSGRHRQESLFALKRACELTEQASASGKKSEVADFSQPTVLISEFGRTPEEDGSMGGAMIRMIEGGKPIRRQMAAFPPPKPAAKIDGALPDQSGLAGQPPPTAPSAQGPMTPVSPSSVKVEVLISTLGDVAFAHVVDGRPEWGASALLAARGWKFEPAKFEGRPVQVSGVITFDVKQAPASPPKIVR